MTTYAIVGSRHWNDYEAFCAHLAGRGIESVVSGGALGVDSMSEAWAQPPVGFKSYPPIQLRDETFTDAAHRRNQQIVDAADSLIAFPCQCSKGTWDTIRRAKKKGIPVEVIRVDCTVKPVAAARDEIPLWCDSCRHEHVAGFNAACLVINCECSHGYRDIDDLEDVL